MLVATVLDDPDRSPIREPLRAALRLLVTLTLEPGLVGPGDIDAVRSTGARDDAIADAIHVCALFNIIDRCADALDFQVPDGFDRIQHARRMLEFGYARIVGEPHYTPERNGRADRMRALAGAILTAQGDLAPHLRRAAFIRACASAAGAPGGHRLSQGAPDALTSGLLDAAPGLEKPGDLSEPLAGFLEKVARHAYKVTDRDIEILKEAGYSEDAIFEAVVSTAVGAGLSRLAIGLAALGEKPSGGAS